MLLPAGLTELLGTYLGRQRWYAGTAAPPDGSVRVIDSDCLAVAGDGARRLHWAIVEAEGVRYQLLIGEGPPGAVEVPETAVVGMAGGAWCYDAVFDAELMLGLFERVVRSAAVRVRPVGAEQSNSSLVFDDRVILKVYRRLLSGLNPDIEVTSALAAADFGHVAEPIATWRADGVDLAFAQRFLAGGADGWALAVDSVGELCGGATVEPGSSPADFAPEAEQLGRVTAQLHLAMSRAFPVEPGGLSARWSAFVDELEVRLAAELPHTGSGSGKGGDALATVIERFRSVRHPGPALRLHGDYHLGQVMRAGGTWYVLDFEGEPARSLDERVRPSSVAKDLSGMLRSIDYAARFARRGRDPASAASDATRASAWERHNRAAFLRGYLSTAGVERLLAAPAEAPTVLAAFELDKALYELRYEQAYRPDWVDIPRAAISRIVDRLARAAPEPSA